MEPGKKSDVHRAGRNLWGSFRAAHLHSERVMLHLAQPQGKALTHTNPASLRYWQSNVDRHLAGLLRWRPVAEGLLWNSSWFHFADVCYEA